MTKQTRIPVTIFAGPSPDEPGCVIHAVTDDGEPAGIEAFGRGPRGARINAHDWYWWARRKVGGRGVDWPGAAVEAIAPGQWCDATHGVQIRTTMRAR